ncbi:oxidative stress-induced growth inhibitor 2 [Engystomops pustulosus]|uniref:oxidative stress-induced growth inhibitor 2 n=1 Tax=Engystomops pustulosus TaxID=76066 RepID=UPI003AFA6E86
MPSAEENPLSSDPPLILPVVIIGNGPSGICLSYMLSGYRPYLSPEALHPNPVLHSKLEEARHLSIPEQDLEYLSEGLEGRSSNPVAVLFDTLLHPNADIGYEYPSVLEWKLEEEHYIPHIVLGKGPPGGAWHDMEGSILTLSLGDWMELPGLKFKDWAMGKRRNVKSDRATPAEVASYYKHYVKLKGIKRNFIDNTYIDSVTRPYREPDNPADGPCEETCIDKESGSVLKNWEIRGYRKAVDGSHQLFTLFAENVVLATGTFDAPARLEVHGENLPYVSHSIAEFEEAVGKGSLSGVVDPVLIVGAGLTAADAVLCALNNNIPVIHAFRRRCNDPNLIFKQLPKKLYPEYHKVYHMMCTQVSSAASNLYPPYTSYPEHVVLSFKPDKKCVLQSTSGLKKVVKISMALVLIGSHPNLFFLKEQGQSLGHHPDQPITCKGNTVEVDPYTYESCKEPNLFALGPLVGDNFIRFLKGGALAIRRCLELRQKKTRHRIVESGSEDGVS